MKERQTRLWLLTGAEVRDGGKTRPVVIEFDPRQPDVLQLRQHGRRHRYPVLVADVFSLAGRLAAERERKAKAEARKAKREGRT